MLAVVAEEDPSRVVWPSCPSKGWVSGVNRLTALPNGSPSGLVPQDNGSAIEVRAHALAPGTAWSAGSGRVVWLSRLHRVITGVSVRLASCEEVVSCPNYLTALAACIVVRSTVLTKAATGFQQVN